MTGGAAEPVCSIVIPVYNEAENLPILLGEVRAAMDPLAKPYEVLFVDDGSTDGSLDVLRDLLRRDPAVRVLAFRANAGQTAALDAGFRAARGSIVVTLDADLQNDPRDIPLLLDALGRCDVAIGWRSVRRDGVVKRVVSKVGNAVRNRLTHERVTDTGCSLKAFRREALASVRLYRGMHRFLPTLCRMEGFSVEEVRVSHRPRVHGRSKYGVLDRLRATAWDLLAVRWMQSRRLTYEVREETRETAPTR